MIKYLHYFQNESSFDSAYNGEGYLEPWVSFTENKGVDYNKSTNITVKYLVGENTYETVEYNKFNVPFFDLVKDYCISFDNGAQRYMCGAGFYQFDGEPGDGRNPITASRALSCSYYTTKEDAADYLLSNMQGNFALYDFQNQCFTPEANGKTIYITYEKTFC